MISRALHGQVYGLSGGCAADRVYPYPGGGGSRGATSVEESLLGRGHEFMHEHERGAMLACFPPWALDRWLALAGTGGSEVGASHGFLG